MAVNVDGALLKSVKYLGVVFDDRLVQDGTLTYPLFVKRFLII